MDREEDNWTPPSARRDEVEGSPLDATREKWVLYSKTYQGLAALVAIYCANKYFNAVLPKTDAIIMVDAFFAAAAAVAMWWVKEGRKRADALLYWLPRTRTTKLAIATGVPVERLLRV